MSLKIVHFQNFYPKSKKTTKVVNQFATLLQNSKDVSINAREQNTKSNKLQFTIDTFTENQLNLPYSCEINQLVQNQKKLQTLDERIKISSYQNGFFTPMMKQKVSIRRKRFSKAQMNQKNNSNPQYSTRSQSKLNQNYSIMAQKKPYQIRIKSPASGYKKLSQRSDKINKNSLLKVFTPQLMQGYRPQTPASSIVVGDRYLIKQRIQEKQNNKLFKTFYSRKIVDGKKNIKRKKYSQIKLQPVNLIDIKPWENVYQQNIEW